MRAPPLAISIIAGLVCLFFSLAASPSYLMLVSAALFFGMLHFVASAIFLQRVRSGLKWLLLLLGAPVFAYTLDDIGRLLALLGLPSFRILA